jgi:hypothetical protein
MSFLSSHCFHKTQTVWLQTVMCTVLFLAEMLTRPVHTKWHFYIGRSFPPNPHVCQGEESCFPIKRSRKGLLQLLILARKLTFVYFFVGAGLGVELKVLYLQGRCSALEPHPQPFWPGYFRYEDLRILCLGWPWTVILPISASQVAGITDVSTGSWPQIV